MTLADWLRRAASHYPEFVSALNRDHPELLLTEVSDEVSGALPWNCAWSAGTNAPAWLRRLTSGQRFDDFAAAWIAHGCLVPSAGETLLCQLADAFKSGAANVFLLQGNVNDYAFDGHLGFASWTELLATYWTRSSLFVAQGSHVQFEAVTLAYTITAGVEVLQTSQGSGVCATLVRQVREHRDSQRGADHDRRVQQDLEFLTERLNDPNSPPLLVLFPRAGLLFPAARDRVQSAVWVEYVLRWAAGSADARSRDDTAPATGRHAIVLAVDVADAIDAELRKQVNGVLSYDVPRPRTEVDRSRMLTACMAACGIDPVPLPSTRLGSRMDGLPFSSAALGRLSEATAGLNYRGIESCMLSIAQRATPDRDALDLIRRERSELIRAESEGLIEIIEPRRDLDGLVGGLDRVKARLNDVVAGMQAPNHSPLRKMVPKGVLFIGPPGTGKSLVAEWLAAACSGPESSVHFVRLGDFRDMWVGQSERNFTRILNVLETFGRVIVFMDEIDQTEGGTRAAGQQHETSRRIFGKLLGFMAEERHRGRILWVAATNRPGNMDAAMLRPGRFDFILPFDVPDHAGCVAILTRHVARCPDRFAMQNTTTPQGLAEAARSMAAKQFSGAEIELVVAESARRARVSGESAVGDARIAEVADDYDGAQKGTADYREMVEECRRFVPFASERMASAQAPATRVPEAGPQAARGAAGPVRAAEPDHPGREAGDSGLPQFGGANGR